MTFKYFCNLGRTQLSGSNVTDQYHILAGQVSAAIVIGVPYIHILENATNTVSRGWLPRIHLKWFSSL